MKLHSYFRRTHENRLDYFSHIKGGHYRDKASERYINWIGVLDSKLGYQEGWFNLH